MMQPFRIKSATMRSQYVYRWNALSYYALRCCEFLRVPATARKHLKKAESYMRGALLTGTLFIMSCYQPTNFRHVVDFPAHAISPRALGFYKAAGPIEAIPNIVFDGFPCIEGQNSGTTGLRVLDDYHGEPITVTLFFCTEDNRPGKTNWGVLIGCVPDGMALTEQIQTADPDVTHKSHENVGSGKMQSVSFTPTPATNAAPGRPLFLFAGRANDYVDTYDGKAWILGAKVEWTTRN